MAQSLVKLTLESNQYERNLRQAQKSWNDFTKGIGLSVGKFTAVGAAIGAVTGALKVVKDAFFNNEQQLDEWGRTVEAAGSLYNGFLNSINTGDISGYLQNMNDIAEAARAAYNAMDELSTFNAFNQINTQRARTGYAEALAGFRLGNMSKEDAMKAAETYKQELRDRQEREQEAYTQAVRKIAAERGVPWGNLEQALTGNYGDYQRLKETMPSGKQIKYMSAGMFGGTMSYEVPMAVTAEERMGEALRKLNDTELQSLQALGAQAERTGEEIAQIDKQLARVVNGRDSKSGKGGGTRTAKTVAASVKNEQTELQQNQQKINTLTQEYVKLGDDASESARQRMEAIREEISLLEKRNGVLELYAEQAQGRLLGDKGVQTTGLGTLTDYRSIGFAGGIDTSSMSNLKSVAKMGDDATTAWDAARSAISTVGSALNNIENPASNIVSTVAQAISNIALAYSEALAKDGGIKSNIWYFIASAAAATASMVATISSVHSATGYAQGGMIPGNTYSGDQVPIMANAGEVVLTRAMQNNLASQLQDQSRASMMQPYVQGENVYLGMNNYTQRSGQGEIVTTGMLRRMGLM